MSEYIGKMTVAEKELQESKSKQAELEKKAKEDAEAA